MGRGRSKLGDGKGGASSKKTKSRSVTSVTTQTGMTADLTGMPLVYNGNDGAIDGALRTALAAQETKRAKAKVEYAMVYDANGNPVSSEARGGKSSANIPTSALMRGAVMTHNHPRGPAEGAALGGTFSGTDLHTFANTKITTIRASAAEGTYSMTKGKGFDATSFKAFVDRTVRTRQSEFKRAASKFDNDAIGKLRSGVMKHSDYLNGRVKLFNKFLVDLHNDFIAGQKQHNYTYTLEG